MVHAIIGEFIGELLVEIVGQVVVGIVGEAVDSIGGASGRRKDPHGDREKPPRWLNHGMREALQRFDARQREALADALVFTLRFDHAEADQEWAWVDRTLAATGARGAAASQLLAGARARVVDVSAPGTAEAMLARVNAAFPDRDSRALLLGMVTLVATADPQAGPLQREAVPWFARALGLPVPGDDLPPSSSTPTCGV